jgi:hypothetical protein
MALDPKLIKNRDQNKIIFTVLESSIVPDK